MEGFGGIAALARSHDGLVTRAQLLASGVSPATIQRWLDAGRVEALHSGVYRLAGAPASWDQRVRAAVMAAGRGAAVSHRAAARLWGIHDAEEVEVVVDRARAPRLHGVVVHRSRDLGQAHLSRRRTLVVTTPMRTIVDLGAVLPPDRVDDALDRALALRLVTVTGVETAIASVAGRGRSGVGVARGILDERALGRDRPDSLLEPRMARLLRAHGLPPAAFQHELRRAGRFVARVDFAYPGRRIAIEVDGFDKHGTPRALQADLARQNALVAMGWTVLRFTWADVVRRPAAVADSIRRVLGTENSNSAGFRAQNGMLRGPGRPG